MITQSQIEQWLRRRGYSVHTVINFGVMFNHLLGVAATEGIRPNHQPIRLRAKRGARQPIRIWEQSDVDAVIKAFEDKGDMITSELVQMAWASGQRLGDIRQLRYDKNYVDGRLHFLTNKTARPILLSLPQTLRERLDARYRPGQLLFPNARGRAFTIASLGEHFRTSVKHLDGYDDVPLKLRTLRHSAILNFARAGCTIPMIASVTGHSLLTVHQVLQHYLPRDPLLAAQAQAMRAEADNVFAMNPVIEGAARTLIRAIDRNLERLRRRRDALLASKAGLETERNRTAEEADSAFLSTVLLKERERAALQAELDSLGWLLRLPDLLREQREAHAQIVAMEQVMREALKEARTAAEADRTSLEQLGTYFLDALVQSGVPGITREDSVALEPPSFYPAVYSTDPADQTVSTFTSMSSGGKKTLFKCCFAIAVHRIASRLEAPLPELLIIDSAMKNISERENRDQFEGFYRMLYKLKAGELASTQMVLIDKEFLPPDPSQVVDVLDRHMQPDSVEHEPLIRYYRGK